MAIRFNSIPIVFTQGLNKKVDEKIQPPPGLLELDNAILLKSGEIRKRNGYTKLTNAFTGADAYSIDLGLYRETGTINNASTLATFGNELLLFNSDGAFSYSDSSPSWQARGAFNNVKVNTTQVARKFPI